MSVGWIPVEPESLRAPRVVVALAGLLFWLAAASMAFGIGRPRLNDLLGGCMLMLFAMVGGWVAMFGTDSAFSGGAPFVGQATNAWLARALFGGGALLCAVTAVHVFWHVLIPRSSGGTNA